MSETKFGVLATLFYVMAVISASAAVMFWGSPPRSSFVSNSSATATYFAIAAIALVLGGFVFHAFHTSTLRRDALLTAILEAILMRQGGTRVPQKPASAATGERKEAWAVTPKGRG